MCRSAITISRTKGFRSMNNGGELAGDLLLPQNIMEAVVKYGARIGVDNLAPHDLRRTFARLAHKGRAALEQIQLSLGHASIVTTERYLGVRQDLQDAPCDSPRVATHAGVDCAFHSAAAPAPRALPAVSPAISCACKGFWYPQTTSLARSPISQLQNWSSPGGDRSHSTRPSSLQVGHGVLAPLEVTWRNCFKCHRRLLARCLYGPLFSRNDSASFESWTPRTLALAWIPFQ